MKYTNILFCTDFSADADIAFVHALNNAKKHDARLHILHVPHSPFTYDRDIVDEHVPASKSREGQAFFDQDIIEQADKDLRAAYEHKLGDFENYEFVIRGGAPDVEILRYARHNNIDLIVMGALGNSDLERMVHGNTLANVSKYAPCQVLAIRNPVKQFTLPGKMHA
jgi:nucleotide-binding universal stress UspA family protein